MERLLVRVAEAAEMLGVSKSKMYQLVGSGAVATVRVGGVLRIPVSALQQLADPATKAAAQGPELPPDSGEGQR